MVHFVKIYSDASWNHWCVGKTDRYGDGRPGWAELIMADK